MTVDTKKYLEFVYTVTSAPSTDHKILEARLRELDANGADVSKLLTAALGLTAESGEFTEVVKKIFLQGYNMMRMVCYQDMILDWIHDCQTYLLLKPHSII